MEAHAIAFSQPTKVLFVLLNAFDNINNANSLGLSALNDGTFDLAAISYQSKLCTLREALAADPRTKISVDEFLGLCNEYGLTGSRAQAAATDLHRSGTILRFTNVRTIHLLRVR